MNALFLWNPLSVSFIKNQVENAKQFVLDDEHCKFIANEKDYKELPHDIYKKYTKIYILAELGWNSDSLFEGYQKGYEIIKNWKGKKAPHIEFFSIVNRNLIYNNVKSKLKFIAKAFPFQDILKINKTYKFDTTEINFHKWNFFKYMAFSTYGILDNKSHALNLLEKSNPNFEKKLKDIVNEVSYYTDFIGDKLKQYTKTIIYTQDYANKLKDLIDERIVEIKGEKVIKLKLPTSLNILVVEDDKDYLESIKTSISRHYNDANSRKKVIATSSGEEALNILKNAKEDFDIIIIDLELLDEDGFYQKVQGVDIYEYQKTLQSTVIGIITGLGRKGISKLLQIDSSFILPKIHLRKFNLNDEIDTLLKTLLDEFNKKEKQVYYSTGPKLGLISKSGYRKELTRLFEIEKTYKEDLWNTARNFANLYLQDNLTFDTENWRAEIFSPGKTILNLTEKIKESHALFLAHRLICLTYVNEHNWNFDEEAFQENVINFMNISDFGKNYLTSRLGFNRKLLFNKRNFIKVSDNGIIKNGYFEGKNYETIHVIEKKNLFPEERQWIDKLNKEKKLNKNKEKKVEFKIKDNSKYIISWLEKNFKDFTPNANFNDFTFLDMYNYFEKDIRNLFKQEKVDRKRLANIISTPPKPVEMELNKDELGILKSIDQIYDEYD